MNITDKLDQLAELHSQRDALTLGKQDLIRATIPAEIQAKLDEIETEFSGALETVGEKISNLEAEITDGVLQNGETTKGHHFMAVYNKGRVSWDTKGLDGFLVAHPEISAFRKVGQPTVSMRRVGK